MTRRAILTYHSLDDSGSVISVRPDAFARQMEALARSGARVVRLAELLAAEQPAVALTFDDGFENFAATAAPLLARYGFPATVFLVTDYCGKTNDWPGQWTSVPRLRLLEWSRVRELSQAGIAFGAHTATHADLSRTPPARARHEILSSKRRIEDETGKAVDAFAYPYGSMTAEARRLVAEHFALGCSARLGYVRPESSREALERLDVYYLNRPSLFEDLFGAGARRYVGVRARLREWRRRWS